MSGQQTTEIQSTGSSVNVGLQVSLRDYFAAAALEKASIGLNPSADEIAKLAYYMADAMLKARGGK